MSNIETVKVPGWKCCFFKWI